MNEKSKHFNLMGLVAAMAILLSGCYPGGPEYVSDYSLVVTDYDPDFNFGSKKTYYMPDTVDFQTNDPDISDERVREFEELMLSTVASNMTDRNYTRIDISSPEAPDLVVTIAAIYVKNTGVAWYPPPGWGWWGGYYPPGWGWGPGYGWGYPGWYPVGYSYSTGTVLIHMGDPNDTEEIDGITTAKVVWVAGLDGLLSSSVSNNQEGVRRGIDQAYTQSPYIQSNQ